MNLHCQTAIRFHIFHIVFYVVASKTKKKHPLAKIRSLETWWNIQPFARNEVTVWRYTR